MSNGEKKIILGYSIIVIVINLVLGIISMVQKNFDMIALGNVVFTMLLLLFISLNSTKNLKEEYKNKQVDEEVRKRIKRLLWIFFLISLVLSIMFVVLDVLS